ncbi:hypothetical protein A3H53_02745 [Candidatus Nomurabacteria bacterium RIFCSPLOWO2_02_FULL_40_10]|uniref:DUF2914 domain-containing protein n=2 Tax=Candidatus Nomuraibacteriota TaxID=1752729 RepID=A0A1F6Y0K5_9BACT|nr:MAG: hypothetical protein A2642_02595 [Candidatus Nomurabacteria bacterium RIFCSPHIGHO2_01_FULL_39_10]OGI99917.1 MAG: hypothetical protein A3H53_02745 [Candidatus Nomurabacteria bacterium RIFCSPLOWO2_02_FULL_40_10]
MRFLHPVHNFYTRFERPISSFSLLLGFIFDAFTLRRVDALWENVWISGYLFIIAVFIILIHLKETESSDLPRPEGRGKENLSKAHFWYVNILQFAFGGVFSAFLVLYFRSADIMVAWPFIALLVLIFIGNEFLKKHYIRLGFQISLFFLSIYWFSIFVIPVLLRKIGAEIFLFSGLVSIILIALFIKVLFYFTKGKFAKSKNLIYWLITIIFILVNILYFTNVIPPIPLSIKEGGVYHSVYRNEKGNLVVAYEKHGWRDYFNLYPDFKKVTGKPVYAFSSIFSPKGLDLSVQHEWQYYNETKDEWATKSVVDLSVVGGRDGGFRTYSKLSNLAPGRWQVNVKTEQGQLIGRLRFTIVPVYTEPALTTMIKLK